MIGRISFVACALAACAHTRTADEYRADTARAFTARGGDIKTCYDHVLATKREASGLVTVRFAVAEKTGKITDVALDKSQTTAPDDLSQCVLGLLSSVTLAPADPNRGIATWSWSFSAGSAQIP